MANFSEIPVIYESVSEIYKPWLEHSSEVTALVIRLEEEEQQRRLVDKDGEHARRNVALQVSEIISTTLRPGWFYQGSSHAFHLWKLTRDTKKLFRSTMRTVSANLLETVKITGALGMEVQCKIENAGEEAQKMLHNSFVAAQDKISGVAHHSSEKAKQELHKVECVAKENSFKAKEGLAKGLEKVECAAHQSTEKVKEGLEKVENAAHQSLEKANSAKNVSLERASSAAHVGLSKAQQIIHKIKEAGLRLFGKAGQLPVVVTDKVNVAFAVFEEECERNYRATSGFQLYAIFNAFATAQLIKDLAPELYRPTFEPNHRYGAKLVEELERARRMRAVLFDSTAKKNANAVATLITQKVAATATQQPVLLKAKKEYIEEPQVLWASTAAM